MAKVSLVNSIVLKCIKYFLVKKLSVSVADFSGQHYKLGLLGLGDPVGDGDSDIRIETNSLVRHREKLNGADHVKISVDLIVDMNSPIFSKDTKIGRDLNKYLNDVGDDSNW